MTAFVLRYRVARTPEADAEMPEFLQKLFEALPHPDRTETKPPVGTAATEQARRSAEEVGRQAIRFVRQRATDLRINAQRVGIMGFSAGGGIAVNAALEHDRQSRPDFVGGIYAGDRPVNAIPASLPPLFLAIADDDAAVGPVSLSRLYETWHENWSSSGVARVREWWTWLRFQHDWQTVRSMARVVPRVAHVSGASLAGGQSSEVS